MTEFMRTETAAYSVTIFVAGDLPAIRQIARAHTYRVGLCVTVEPVEFVYTGGAETGGRIGLINYARYPAEKASIWEKAEELAYELIEGLHQHSATVMDDQRSVWLTRRAQ